MREKNAVTVRVRATISGNREANQKVRLRSPRTSSRISTSAKHSEAAPERDGSCCRSSRKCEPSQPLDCEHIVDCGSEWLFTMEKWHAEISKEHDLPLVRWRCRGGGAILR